MKHFYHRDLGWATKKLVVLRNTGFILNLGSSPLAEAAGQVHVVNLNKSSLGEETSSLVKSGRSYRGCCSNFVRELISLDICRTLGYDERYGVEQWEKVKGSDEAYKKLQEAEPCDVFKLASWTLLQFTSFRGLQFTYGPAIAANNQSTFELLWRMFRVNICLTITLSFLILTRDAGLGSPKSALLSLDVPSFPGLNLLSETLYTTCFGIWVACSVDNLFNSLALLATCVHKIAILLNCPQEILEICDPKYFPSIFDSPHKSNSIAHFWGKGWHTVLQRIFLISGGLPIAWLVRRLGASHRILRLAGMFGVFASSAFLHEYAALQIAQRLDPNLALSTWFPESIVYFMLQPLAILVEPFVIPLIPKRLGGGRLWVWTFGLLAAFPFRDQYLFGMGVLQDVPPLKKWSMIYLLRPVKL
ncbi:uncharacterized protein MELLADRAFT_103817 [Melampsora larici-populina 98AG31]|uniref:Wax synthase domain-containing protein n=1 Tax=Melampsora larici-populina (strain 98AG31 / pathotype 3-4-7) TaxID=747676 RepID=F4RCJ7_MELLP|nr:uncharacterized protein MELLADRAFT_103817 [Melampsora larici-populina 98AG31]EGG09747.1 hypothetical protein MELLADRAFT_103817 [Melampsora larici-populina 98AG31]